MTNKFNLTPQMQEYFNALPKTVQEAIMQSGVNPSSLEELKSIAQGYTENEG